MFTAKDISLKRLTQVVDVVGLSLADLIQLAHEEEIKQIHLTARQEKALYDSSQLFRVFWLLTVEGKSTDEIKKFEKMTADLLERALLKLENLDLIRRTLKGKVTSAHRGLFRWRGHGPLLKKLNEEWSLITLKKVLAGNGDQHLHRLLYLKLSLKSKNEFYQQLEELMAYFSRLSQKEKLNYQNKDLIPISSLLAITTSGFI